MKILKLLWQKVGSGFAFLGLLLFTEPVINLTMGAICGSILLGGCLLIWFAFNYCLNSLSHTTGWQKNDIIGVLAGLWTGAIIIALIVYIHLTLAARWRETHPGTDLSFGRRFLIGMRFWCMALLAAALLVSGLIALGAK